MVAQKGAGTRGPIGYNHLGKPLGERITGGGRCMIYSIKVPLHGDSEIASPPQGRSILSFSTPIRETAAGRGLAWSRHRTKGAPPRSSGAASSQHLREAGMVTIPVL